MRKIMILLTVFLFSFFLGAQEVANGSAAAQPAEDVQAAETAEPAEEPQSAEQAEPVSTVSTANIPILSVRQATASKLFC